MRALYSAASGMHAAQTQIENIANNLANASTTGFKKSRETFADLMYQKLPGGKDPIQMGSGSRLAGLARNFAVGDAIQTNNQTDLMIQGAGFFRYTMPDGSVRYTRDGHFSVNAENQLVTADGGLLEPEITVEAGESLSINAAGDVTRTKAGETVEVGTLMVYTFPNPAGLEALGGNAFIETTASGPAAEVVPGQEGAGSLLQGAIEGSNVDAAEELVAMITAQRGYELSSKVIQAADDMMQTAASLRR